MENSYPAEDNMEEDGSDVSDGRRRRRYRNIPMEEASDPDVWMEENHYSSDSSSSSVSGNADNSAAPGYSRYGGEHCLNQMMSARDALLSLIRERLDSAYERGDMEAADELEQMLANYGCLWADFSGTILTVGYGMKPAILILQLWHRIGILSSGCYVLLRWGWVVSQPFGFDLISHNSHLTLARCIEVLVTTSLVIWCGRL